MATKKFDSSCLQLQFPHITLRLVHSYPLHCGYYSCTDCVFFELEKLWKVTFVKGMQSAAIQNLRLQY